MIYKEQIYSLIEHSKRPLVIVGNGVRIANAHRELVDFLSHTNIPFVVTWAAKDMFVDSIIFGVSGSKNGNLMVQNADLIISLGCRLDAHHTGSDILKFAPNAYKVVVDIDQAELDKHKFKGTKICMDVKKFLTEITTSTLEFRDYYEWLKQVQIWWVLHPVCPKKYYEQEKYVNPYVFMNELSMATKDGDVIITDVGATLTWTMQGYRPYKQRLISAFNHSPMGYALPATIGAQYAKPKSNVICIIGDGGMMMNLQELETIAYNKLPIKVFVLNNKGYGIIRQTQDTWLEGRHYGTGPKDGLGIPDFSRIAEAFKIYSTCIVSHRHLERISNSLNFKFPILCEVMIDPAQKIIPKLKYGQSLEEIQ